MQEFPGHEKGVETDAECHAGDLDTDPVGNPDIRAITEEGEKPGKETLDTVKFVETPESASLGHDRVDDRRSQDDQEAEEENMGGARYRWGAREADDGDKTEKSHEKKEEGVSEFEEEERKRLGGEEPERAFYADSEQYEGKESGGKQGERKGFLFDGTNDATEKRRHSEVGAME